MSPVTVILSYIISSNYYDSHKKEDFRKVTGN